MSVTVLHSMLLEHLSPALQAQFEQTGDLPVEVRAELAAHLRDLLQAHAAYIPMRLVQRQLTYPVPGEVTGTFWRGSLLFADLSGFTALSEQLSTIGRQGAEEVSGIVNHLFDALVEEVARHQGMLLKFGGDALTAFFDEEMLQSQHAAAASSAALAMQRRMATFANLRTRAGTFKLRLRVGVHSGRLFAAEVGDTTHIELVITGREVNRVAAAQEIAAPGEVVVTDQTAQLLHGAQFEGAERGFQRILDLPEPDLPHHTDPLLIPHGHDLATLEMLATQVAALRPYLVRGLPQRFLDSRAAEMGEFRPVSVMFANFHNFSDMLEILNDAPELAASVLNAYFRRAQQIIHHYDGSVNKVDMATHGDKLMALFGAPTAHEDDPLRVVHCALDLRQALHEANTEIHTLFAPYLDAYIARYGTVPALLERIGINTGTVFAGRVGGAQRYEYTVMGSTVNLAARLMAKAADGMVMISPFTRTIVEQQVAVIDHAPLQLKGLKEPITPGVVQGRDADSRISSRSDTALPHVKLVGRDTELAQMLDAAVQALNGAGRVIALVGEAGIGKTRLCSELVHQMVLAGDPAVEPDTTENFVIYTGECQSYEQSTPYATIRLPLRALLEVSPKRSSNRSDTDAVGMLDALEQAVMRYAPALVRFAPLLADALGVAVQETPLTRALTPEQRYDRLHELIVALFIGAAQTAPVILMLEDIQWADASSLELLGDLARAIQDQPILMLLNYRPTPPIAEAWQALPTTLRLTVRELSHEKGEALLAALLDHNPPPAMRSLVERTQGNPFYIEELIRTLIASGILARNPRGDWYLTRPLDEAALPRSIEGLVIARLDKLPEPQYDMVQIASVVGRRFQQPIVAGIYPHRNLLDSVLEALIHAEVTQPDFHENDQSYLFRHALLRDVAYETILFARRRELHRQVALRLEALTSDDPQARQNVLSVIARHYLLAEVWPEAFAYHILAGQQAQQRYANREALSLFASALDIVPHLPMPIDPDQRIRQVIDLYERRGMIFALLGETDDAVASFLEALALLDVHQEMYRETRIRLHRLLASVEEQSSEFDTAFRWLEQGMALANDSTRPELARCYLLGAKIYYRRGDMHEALDWINHSLQITDERGDLADRANVLRLKGVIQSDIGELSSSIQALEEARTIWEQLHDDISGKSRILNDLGAVYDQMGRWHEAIACYEQAKEISESIGDIVGIAYAANNIAYLLVGRNELQRAYDLYVYSGECFNQMGSAWGVVMTDLNRAEIFKLKGEPQAVLAIVQHSLEMLERIKSRTFIPETLRLGAEASLNLGDYPAAKQYAEQSLQEAESMGMTLEQGIAQRVLGQIALAQGEHHHAETYFALARETLTEADSPYDVGKVAYWQAQLAATRNQREVAQQFLCEAIQTFIQLDAQRDLDCVRALAEQYHLPLAHDAAVA